jgi:YVTN family beta-propeller protein
VGAYPRGIAIAASAQTAYVAVSGANRIAIVNLKDFSLDWLEVGRSPHQLALSNDNQFLYAILSGDGQLTKIDLAKRQVLNQVNTGNLPRSLALSSDGNFVYVANYASNTVSKVRTDTMQIAETVNVPAQPLGVTYDPKTRQIWVACASGSIVVLQD